jgi:hypothetical protein
MLTDRTRQGLAVRPFEVLQIDSFAYPGSGSHLSVVYKVIEIEPLRLIGRRFILNSLVVTSSRSKREKTTKDEEQR